MPSSDRTERYTFWLMGFTAVLAVATIALFLVTWWVAESTKELAVLAKQQASDTKEAIELSTRQTAASEKAAESAAASTAISLDTARRQLRAYMSFTTRGTENVRDQIYPTTSTFARIYHKNVGQTPALRLQRFGEAKFVKYPFDGKDPDILNIDNEKLLKSVNESGGFVEHPGKEESYPLDLKEKITEKTLIEFQKGTLAFYVMTALAYKDIYDEVHYERQCYFYLNQFGRYYTCATHGDSK